MNNYTHFVISIFSLALVVLGSFYIYSVDFIWVDYSYKLGFYSFPVQLMLMGHFTMGMALYLWKLPQNENPIQKLFFQALFSSIIIYVFYKCVNSSGALLLTALLLRYSWATWHLFSAECFQFSGRSALKDKKFKDFLLLWVGLAAASMFLNNGGIIFGVPALLTSQKVILGIMGLLGAFWIYSNRKLIFGSEKRQKLEFLYFTGLIFALSIIAIIPAIVIVYELAFLTFHVIQYYFAFTEMAFKNPLKKERNFPIIGKITRLGILVPILFILGNLIYFILSRYALNEGFIFSDPRLNGGNNSFYISNNENIFFHVLFDARLYHGWVLVHLTLSAKKDWILLKGFLSQIFRKHFSVLIPTKVEVAGAHREK